MFRSSSLWSKQYKQEINRPVVDRIKRDRPLEAGEQATKPANFRQLGGRDGDPMTDAGAAEPLSLREHVINSLFSDPDQGRSAAREFLQCLLFVADPQLGDDAARD